MMDVGRRSMKGFPDDSEKIMRRARWGMARIGLLTTTALVLCLAGLWRSSPSGAAQNANKKPPGVVADKENKVLQTKDGLMLHVTYYKSNMEKDAPVVVLLHMKDGNR